MNDRKPALPLDPNNADVDTTNRNQGEPSGGSPKQPNDRDENVGSTSAAPDAKVAQAKRDLDHGLVDTSRAEATDAAYDRQKK